MPETPPTPSEVPDSPLPLAAVHSYHAHVYFDGPVQRARAERLRERIAERFSVVLGRWHDQPVGPHGAAMYQVAFDIEVFARIVPWLMLNRDDLSVLIHPNTHWPRADHLVHALWLGVPLALRGDVLPVQSPPVSNPPLAINTSPSQPA